MPGEEVQAHQGRVQEPEKKNEQLEEWVVHSLVERVTSWIDNLEQDDRRKTAVGSLRWGAEQEWNRPGQYSNFESGAEESQQGEEVVAQLRAENLDQLADKERYNSLPEICLRFLQKVVDECDHPQIRNI